MKYLKKLQLYERKLRKSYNLIDVLSYNTIQQYYDDHYYSEPDISDFIEWGYDFWQYVDDKRFVSDYIDREIDYYVNDFKYNNFNESDLIDYIKKYMNDDIKERIKIKYIEDNYDKTDPSNEEDIKSVEDEDDPSHLLNEFSEDYLRDFIYEYMDVPQFCEEYVNDMYYHETAKDIMSNNYNVRDNRVFRDNDENIMDYVDINALIESYNENEDAGEILSQNIDSDNRLQQMIFDQDETTARDLIEGGNLSNTELAESYDFQKAYITDILEEQEELNNSIRNKAVFIYKKMKNWFVGDYSINDEIIEEYQLDDIIEGYEEGFIK